MSNKKEILKNVSGELKDKTCFIITHRRSMLRYCDKVITLKEGGAAEIGEPKE